MKLTWPADGAQAHRDADARDGDPCRSSPRSCAPTTAARSASCACRSSAPARTREVYAALRKLKKRGAQAFVLDLRDNGGGLVDEAQLIASAFLPDGTIVTTRGRTVKERTLNATGDPIVPKAPM